MTTSPEMPPPDNLGVSLKEVMDGASSKPSVNLSSPSEPATLSVANQSEQSHSSDNPNSKGAPKKQTTNHHDFVCRYCNSAVDWKEEAGWRTVEAESSSSSTETPKMIFQGSPICATCVEKHESCIPSGVILRRGPSDTDIIQPSVTKTCANCEKKLSRNAQVGGKHPVSKLFICKECFANHGDLAGLFSDIQDLRVNVRKKKRIAGSDSALGQSRKQPKTATTTAQKTKAPSTEPIVIQPISTQHSEIGSSPLIYTRRPAIDQ